MRLYEDI